jgi:hypothetical protein
MAEDERRTASRRVADASRGPQDGDVIVTRESSGMFTVRQLPSLVQLSTKSREEASGSRVALRRRTNWMCGTAKRMLCAFSRPTEHELV